MKAVEGEERRSGDVVAGDEWVELGWAESKLLLACSLSVCTNETRICQHPVIE